MPLSTTTPPPLPLNSSPVVGISGITRHVVRAVTHRLRPALTRLDRLRLQSLVWGDRARAELGVRRGVHAGGVYYKELSPERLSRALSKRGRGHKDYRVTFVDGTKQVVRACERRCFADLTGAEGVHRIVRVGHLFRPGSRVLEVAARPMVTGYSSAYLAALVGHSGSVVSLIDDAQGLKFARKRHAAANLSYEFLQDQLSDELAGEMPGAFQTVIALGLPIDTKLRNVMLRELNRVLSSPGESSPTSAGSGWMLLGLADAPGVPNDRVQLEREQLKDALRAFGIVAEVSGTGDVLFAKDRVADTGARA